MSDALSALSTNNTVVSLDELATHLTFMQSCIGSAASDARHRAGNKDNLYSKESGEFHLPLLSLPKVTPTNDNDSDSDDTSTTNDNDSDSDDTSIQPTSSYYPHVLSIPIAYYLLLPLSTPPPFLSLALPPQGFGAIPRDLFARTHEWVNTTT